MSELLHQLAENLNISTKYSYFAGGKNVDCVASDELLRFLIEDMGYAARNDEDILKSMDRLSKKRWQRAMEAVYVNQADDLKFDIILKKDETKDDIKVFLAKEGQQTFKSVHAQWTVSEEKKEGRNLYVRLNVKITDKVEPQYYVLKVQTAHNEYKAQFIVAPKKCYELDKKNKKKLYGFAVQLYSLKSKQNWGVGDFSDLSAMVDIAADNGGDVIGLNPLNVLLHDYPEAASPYASISRLFLNPIYIDVEKVPLFEKKDKDEKAVREAKESENINYTKVYQTKVKALKAIFERLKKDKGSKYAASFEKFKSDNAKELNKLAVFQAICHERAKAGGKLSAKAEAELGSALGSGVEKFALQHQNEIEFFKFLQFEADRQLKLVFDKIKKRGLAIGLYRDMPVGVSKDSAEVWSDKYLYVQKSGAGVPPDSYFPTGQKWGLGAFQPAELKERAYKPFINILRACMRYAGAVRIDHIMGLSRLFIIPDEGVEGTYIRYNAQDMMNILALESYLNKCVVVGECIGNVEAGYTESLLSRGIYLLGVLWSERKDENGTMKAPDEYEEKYFASVGTHDMPPLKAWWFGREIATMRNLGLYSEEDMVSAYHWREHERRLLLGALDKENVWPKDNLRHGDYLYGEAYPEGIDEAVHAYMAKTKSEVLLLMPEDIFQSEKIQNLPGTDVDKFPNWRAKQVIDIEDIADSEAFHRHINIVKKYR